MTAPQDRQPATEAGRTLVEHVSNLNSRAFPLMTGEDLRVVEREARAQLIAELREGVGGLEGTPFRAGGRDESFDMCPNCVTPWKCNGPHTPPEHAPSGYLVDRAAVLALIEKASEPEGAKE